MLSAKTRKAIIAINNYDVDNDVPINTNGFLSEVIDVANLLKREDIYISVTNTSGDIIYIYPGRVVLNTGVYIDGFASNEIYSVYYPVILIAGNNKTPHVTNLSRMLSIFSDRHQHKISLSKLLKDNIDNVYDFLVNKN